MLTSMIIFSHVTKEYDGVVAIDDLSMTIGPGEFVCLTGPSGAGKSSIVNLLIRAENATSGSIEVDGADLTKIPMGILQLYRRKTGVLFQDYKLLPDRTVRENIAFPLEVVGDSDDAITARTDELLTMLKLQERADAFPHQLSGGEKTRTALARALVHRPSILIADEPTGNIDPDQSIEILRILREINASGVTVILATHDKIVVDALKVRVVRLEKGRIVRDSVGLYRDEVLAVETTTEHPGEQHKERSHKTHTKAKHVPRHHGHITPMSE